MKQWLESVYSDGTKYFVSNPLPAKKDTVQIQIRFYEDAPVEHVFLRTKINGTEQLFKMQQSKVENGLVYYETSVQIFEDCLHYHFYLATKNEIFYYNQKGITTYIPNELYDFKILTDYKQPTWVKDAVFYQIFPERFCNGNPDNDVKDKEYTFDGHDTIQIKDWNQEPLPYDKSFCLDFYGGDLEGVTKQIPYLKELGVTAIYLNPIFYGATVHKYDCLDYFTVDPHFGGDEALIQLSNALHENGMKLILDVSINHTGTANKWFNKEGIFYDKSIGAYNNKDAKEREYYFFDEDNSYKAWWDVETLPTLNYTSKALREALYEKEDSVVKKWLKPPFSIDGWRFDVADVMARNNEIQLHHEVWPAIRKSIKEENENAYVLAEDWCDCAEFLQGKEWDSAMNYYGFTRPVRDFVGDGEPFLNKQPELANISYKPTAMELSQRILEHLAQLPTVIQENQFNLLDSHDIHRLHNNKKVRFDEYRGAVIMLFTMIGATNIYYGDEAQIKGRVEDIEGCRYPMPWKDNFKEGEYFHLYQTLAHLKREKEALKEGSFKILSQDYYVFSYARFTDKQLILTVCSTDHEERILELPIKAFGKWECGAKEDLLKTPLSYEVKDGYLYLKVKPHTSYLIEV